MNLPEEGAEGLQSNYFRNDQHVSNQAVNQSFYGTVSFDTRHHTNAEESTTKELDNDILRSLAFNEMFERLSTVQRPHKDTCKWIFDLKEWKEWTRKPSGLFWLKGKPGSGKSTIMAHIYNRLLEQPQSGEEEDIFLEFFFSNRGVELQKTPLGMLRSLLNQLFREDPLVRPRVRAAYKRKSDAFGGLRSAWNWQLAELEDLFRQCITISEPQRKPITIFVDALDEAGKEFAYSTARYFHQINEEVDTLKIQAKICISSRHYPILSFTHRYEICVEDHNGLDIAKFIEDRLDPQNFKYVDSHNTESWGDLEEYLIKHARGVFLWGSIVLPLIEFICVASRPLSTNELDCALTTKDPVTLPSLNLQHVISESRESEERIKLRIKALSGGLVEISRNLFLLRREFTSDDVDDENSYGQEETVQVIHQSVHDFLISEGISMLARLEANPQNIFHFQAQLDGPEDIKRRCHRTVYRRCLNYIDVVRQNIAHIESNDSIFSNNKWLNYSLKFLFHHAANAGSHRFQDLKEEILFLQRAVTLTVTLNGAGENRFGNHGTTILHAVSGQGLCDLVELLIKDGIAIDMKDDHGNTPLHYAARGQDCMKIGNILLRNGGNIEARNASYQTPLHIAAYRNETLFAQWLLHKGADPDVVDGQGESPLHLASCHKDGEMVRLLVQEGADIDSNPEATPLHVAVCHDNVNVVKILLDHGADCSITDIRGLLPLHCVCASYVSDLEILLLLIERSDGHINQLEPSGLTPLNLALCYGRFEFVKPLVEKGASPDVGDFYKDKDVDPDWFSKLLASPLLT